mgnify:CR=1 FL=1
MEPLVVKEETRSAMLITATLHGMKCPSNAHHRSLVCPSSGLPLGHVASGHPFKIRAQSCFPEQKQGGVLEHGKYGGLHILSPALQTMSQPQCLLPGNFPSDQSVHFFMP